MSEIGNYTFYGVRPTDVFIYAEIPPSVELHTFSDYSATLHVLKTVRTAYSSAQYWSNFNNVANDLFPTSPTIITMSTNGCFTYCNSYPLNFTDIAGLKAYIASGFSPSTGELVLTRVYNVPAGEGVLLKGEAGEFEVPYAETDMVYSNLLKGVTAATNISPVNGDYTNFILADGTHGIGFYPLSQAGEIAAGKAYLQLPTSAVTAAGSRGIKLRFDSEESGATSINECGDAHAETEMYYDTQGRRITDGALKKGLYIIRTAGSNGNGKKVMIR